MPNSLETAFLVLVVGMITVFVILGLVVISGKLLIKFVNTYLPKKERYSPKPSNVFSIGTSSQKVISDKKLAAIVAAVNIVTKGKGGYECSDY